ncbi:hypothetical protein HYV83_05205 [Candidatus Woesearchaeota archaeon]|nr:hypothetical protein [Candidatus Woesearchaeota archaeon]
MLLVCDASTLILLQKIGLLERIARTYTVRVTRHVYHEAVEKGKVKGIPDAYALEAAFTKGLIGKEQPKKVEKVKELMAKFGTAKGESETIALCLETKGAIAGVDDRKAMNICNIYGLPFVTALTLVVAAKDVGIITGIAAKEMAEKLRVYGRYKDELVNEALKTLESGGK